MPSIIPARQAYKLLIAIESQLVGQGDEKKVADMLHAAIRLIDKSWDRRLVKGIKPREDYDMPGRTACRGRR